MRIETATIRRLCDALLQSGRRQSAVVSTAYETLTREGLLSGEEQEAVRRVDPMAEIMYLMIAADRVVTDDERHAIRGAIRGLTDNLLQDGTIKVMLESYQAALDAEGREARLKAIASCFDEPSDAEGAFALAAAVALADDQVAEEERAFIKEMADWFGITPDRSSVILNQLEEDRDES